MTVGRDEFGHVPREEIEQAIEARLAASNADKKEVLASLLGEAVEALLEINRRVSTSLGTRGLVAPALEKFAGAARE